MLQQFLECLRAFLLRGFGQAANLGHHLVALRGIADGERELTRACAGQRGGDDVQDAGLLSRVDDPAIEAFAVIVIFIEGLAGSILQVEIGIKVLAMEIDLVCRLLLEKKKRSLIPRTEY